ncbi:MAG: zf-HC2 domain-containing protein [Nitrospirota bacterium]
MTRRELWYHVLNHVGTKVTCKHITEVITDYLEGKLGLVDRLRFQLHLGVCLGCRRYLRQMRQTVHTLGQLPPEPMPPAVRDELLRRFQTWKTTRPGSSA